MLPKPETIPGEWVSLSLAVIVSALVVSTRASPIACRQGQDPADYGRDLAAHALMVTGR
jgi:hypothetical protein